MNQGRKFLRGPRLAAVLLTSLVLAACGGGGGGGDSGTTDPNAGNPNPVVPPVIPPVVVPPPADGSTRLSAFPATLQANSRYTISNSASQTAVLNLPPELSIAPGNTVGVRGELGAWSIAAASGQSINTRALPGGVAPGSNTWVAQTDTAPQNWWYLASSNNGQKLAGVANEFANLRVAGSPTTGYVWTSADAGVTWVQRSPPSANWAGVASSADGTVLAAAATGGDIWISRDSGATWTNPPSGQQSYNSGSGAAAGLWVSIGMSSDGQRMAAVRIGGNIWTSIDFGATWVERAATVGVRDWRSIASSADGLKLVATNYTDYFGGPNTAPSPIYTSANGGATWTASPASYQSPYRVTSSADGVRLAMAERYGNTWSSVNSGATWQVSNAAGQSYNAIRSSADGKVVVAVSPNNGARAPDDTARGTPTGMIYVSTDSGVTFTPAINAPVALWRATAVSYDGNWLVAGVNNGRIYTSKTNRAASLPGTASTNYTLTYSGGGIYDAAVTAP